jgi:hypothetical protein
VSQHAKSDHPDAVKAAAGLGPASNAAASNGPASTAAAPHTVAPNTVPTAADIKRWRQYLADERAEASVYRDLAQNRSGEERAILLALAEAEGRHEAH